MRWNRAGHGLVLLLAAALVGCKRPNHPPPPTLSTAPVDAAPIVSGKKTRVYHLRDCLYARDIADRDLLGFHTSDEAEARGRIPCEICHPRQPDAKVKKGNSNAVPSQTPAGTP